MKLSQIPNRVSIVYFYCILFFTSVLLSITKCDIMAISPRPPNFTNIMASK